MRYKNADALKSAPHFSMDLGNGTDAERNKEVAEVVFGHVTRNDEWDAVPAHTMIVAAREATAELARWVLVPDMDLDNQGILSIVFKPEFFKRVFSHIVRSLHDVDHLTLEAAHEVAARAQNPVTATQADVYVIEREHFPAASPAVDAIERIPLEAFCRSRPTAAGIGLVLSFFGPTFGDEVEQDMARLLLQGAGGPNLTSAASALAANARSWKAGGLLRLPQVNEPMHEAQRTERAVQFAAVAADQVKTVLHLLAPGALPNLSSAFGRPLDASDYGVVAAWYRAKYKNIPADGLTSQDLLLLNAILANIVPTIAQTQGETERLAAVSALLVKEGPGTTSGGNLAQANKSEQLKVFRADRDVAHLLDALPYLTTPLEKMDTIQDYMEDDHARWGVLAILLKKIAHFDEKTQGLAQLHLALPLYVGQVIAAKDDGSLDEAAAAFEASPAFVKSLVDFEVGKLAEGIVDETNRARSLRGLAKLGPADRGSPDGVRRFCGVMSRALLIYGVRQTGTYSLPAYGERWACLMENAPGHLATSLGKQAAGAFTGAFKALADVLALQGKGTAMEYATHKFFTTDSPPERELKLAETQVETMLVWARQNPYLNRAIIKLAETADLVKDPKNGSGGGGGGGGGKRKGDTDPPRDPRKKPTRERDGGSSPRQRDERRGGEPQGHKTNGGVVGQNLLWCVRSSMWRDQPCHLVTNLTKAAKILRVDDWSKVCPGMATSTKFDPKEAFEKGCPCKGTPGHENENSNQHRRMPPIEARRRVATVGQPDACTERVFGATVEELLSKKS